MKKYHWQIGYNKKFVIYWEWLISCKYYACYGSIILYYYILYSSVCFPSGIEYTLGRIPIASCDFSTHIYSYDDNPGDLTLTNFSLANEDLQHKVDDFMQLRILYSNLMQESIFIHVIFNHKARNPRMLCYHTHVNRTCYVFTQIWRVSG